MKTMFRIMGMTILGLFLTLIMIQEVNVDIRKDELESISSLAMNQTQQIMEEQIEDSYYGTDNARSEINSNDEYFNLYVENFEKQIATNCVYDIELLNADYQKGLLDVNVTCNYYNALGERSQISERKINIIEQVDNASNTQSYKITYNYNKGHISGTNPTKYSILSDESTLTLKNPTRNGYEFIGWTGSNIPADEPQMTVHIDKNGTEDLMFIANWKVVPYSIAYIANDNEVIHGRNYKAVMPNNPTTYNVETDSFTLIQPSREHYTFIGWTGSNGTTANTSVTIVRGRTGNRTFTANWRENTYSISYVMNDKSNGKGSTDAVNNVNNTKNFTISSGDENDRIKLYAPTRVGYIFAGWTGTNVEKIGNDYYITNVSTGGNRTVTANWVAKTINVTLSSNSEANMTKQMTFTYDSAEGLRTLSAPSAYFGENGLRVGWTVAAEMWETGKKVENAYIEQVYNSNSSHSSTNKVVYKSKWVKVRFYYNYSGNNNYEEVTYYYNNNNWTGQDKSLLNSSTGNKFPMLNRQYYTQQWYGASKIDYDYKQTVNKAFDIGQEVYNSWIVQNHGATINLYAAWKANIRYGYQTVTSWNSGTTSYVASTYYLKQITTKPNQSFSWYCGGGAVELRPDLSGGTVVETGRYQYSYDVGFIPTSISISGYMGDCDCDSHSRRKMKIQGSNDGVNFVDLTNYGHSANTSQCYRYYRFITGGGCWTYVHYELNGIQGISYASPRTWSSTQGISETINSVPEVVYEANSSNGNTARRRVYSRDDGQTWIACNGNSCPTE